MKIGFYNDFQPCIVKENGVVDMSDVVKDLHQDFLDQVISTLVGWQILTVASLADPLDDLVV